MSARILHADELRVLIAPNRESDHGDWVICDSHEALRARLASAEEALRQIVNVTAPRGPTGQGPAAVCADCDSAVYVREGDEWSDGDICDRCWRETVELCGVLANQYFAQHAPAQSTDAISQPSTGGLAMGGPSSRTQEETSPVASVDTRDQLAAAQYNAEWWSKACAAANERREKAERRSEELAQQVTDMRGSLSVIRSISPGAYNAFGVAWAIADLALRALLAADGAKEVEYVDCNHGEKGHMVPRGQECQPTPAAEAQEKCCKYCGGQIDLKKWSDPDGYPFCTPMCADEDWRIAHDIRPTTTSAEE